LGQKVLLLHGWGGSNYPHWQSYLAGEIAKEYGKVSFLKFSDPDAPKLDVWEKELLQELEDFKPDVVICHSLANTLWFHICNHSLLKEVQKLYLVAPPSLSCALKELEEFFPQTLPQTLYAKNAMLITSTNDPYMDMEEAEQIQKKLNIPMKVLENAGHINNESGFGEWPWMLKEISS